MKNNQQPPISFWHAKEGTLGKKKKAQNAAPNCPPYFFKWDILCLHHPQSCALLASWSSGLCRKQRRKLDVRQLQQNYKNVLAMYMYEYVCASSYSDTVQQRNYIKMIRNSNFELKPALKSLYKVGSKKTTICMCIKWLFHSSYISSIPCRWRYQSGLLAKCVLCSGPRASVSLQGCPGEALSGTESLPNG